MTGVVYIYGLFTKRSKRCLYVGCTRDPRLREIGHRSAKTTGATPFKFQVLKEVPKHLGPQEESKHIAFYRAMGEAQFNKSLMAQSHRQTMTLDNVLGRLSKLTINQEFMVDSYNLRTAALSAAKNLRRMNVVDFILKTWCNRDGTYTLRAVKP